MTENQRTLAKAAYRGYCHKAGGKSLITGEKLPGFDDLKPEIQEAWKVAAVVVWRRAIDQLGNYAVDDTSHI